MTKKVASTRMVACNIGNVAAEDREVQQVAGAGPVEHRLHQDRAAEQIAELQSHQGEHRRGGVPADVADHRPARETLGGERADEFLAEDLQHRGAHQPADHAHRDQRQRHHRKHEILQPSVQRQRVVAHALRRQPVVQHREGQHQHDGAPVVRQADAGGCDGGEQLVRPAAVKHRGEQAEDRAEREAESRREDGEDEGVAESGDKLAPHRGRVEHRQPEVAAQRPAEPEQVLHVERLVEAERLLHLGDHLGRGLGRHQQVDRIAGDDVHKAEHDQRDAQQDGNGLDDTAGGEDEHGRVSRRGQGYAASQQYCP